MTKRNLAKSFRRKPAPPPEPKATGRYFRADPCPACGGSGRVVAPWLRGVWHINYRYQDCNETCGPYLEADAVRRMVEHDDRTCMVTLIGPDGQIYTVPK